jgi:hypothetical protein
MSGSENGGATLPAFPAAETGLSAGSRDEGVQPPYRKTAAMMASARIPAMFCGGFFIRTIVQQLDPQVSY